MQKVLSLYGFGSRRGCDDLIAAGRVKVNGQEAVLGQRIDPSVDRVEVDGTPILGASDHVYLVLNKPVGVVTTAVDTHGRPVVIDLVPSDPRVFSVGRLDMDTSGLLLMTNDGEFANRLTHPRYGVPKTYIATVNTEAGPRHVSALKKGVELEDGVALAEDIRVTNSSGRTLVELTVREGRNRLVRRLLHKVGLPVKELTRTAVGPLKLTGLAPGEWRNLTFDEIQALLTVAGADGPLN